MYRMTFKVLHHGPGVSPYRPRLEIVTYHQLLMIDVHSERMISSEHDGWSRHIQLYGDTNSRRRINQLPPLSPITWRELMSSDVIRVPVDNVCNVSDLKSYTTQNTQTLNGFKRFSYNSKVQISS